MKPTITIVLAGILLARGINAEEKQLWAKSVLNQNTLCIPFRGHYKEDIEHLFAVRSQLTRRAYSVQTPRITPPP